MSLLLKNGNIVNVENGEVTNGSILIKEGMIEEVGKGNDADQIVDLNGKYIIPGLIDMHCHIKEGFANLFVAAGVTTVRNTGGNVIELRDLIHAPTDAPTPRVYSADRLIDGPPGLWGETSPWTMNTNDLEESRAEVRRQANEGAKFIKVYGLLSPEVMQAVVDEAHQYGLEVSCDLIHSTQVNALEAAKMGVKWFEHNSGFIQAMYPEWSTRSEQEVWDQIDWEHPDESRIQDICKQMLNHDSYLCPTIVIHDQAKRLPNYWEPEGNFSNEALNNQWEQVSKHAEAYKQQFGIQTNFIKAITKTYHDLGGVVVAGTDTPAVWAFPGMALHRELELLVESGLTELETLQAATIRAAQSINLKNLGAIKSGNIADLLILDDNPLSDIRNTRNINSVVKGGKIYHQEEIINALPAEEEVEQKLKQFMSEFDSMVELN